MVSIQDFSQPGHRDVENDEIPTEAMMIFVVDGGLRVAVRPSGTEPKIKFYLFAHEPPGSDAAAAKERARARLSSAWRWLHQDAERRLS